MKLTQKQMVIVFVVAILIKTLLVGFIVASNMSDEIETWANEPTATSMTKKDVQVVQEAVQEFESEMTVLGEELDKIGKELQSIDNDAAALVEAMQKEVAVQVKPNVVFDMAEYNISLMCSAVAYIAYETEEDESKKQFWENVGERHAQYAYNRGVSEKQHDEDLAMEAEEIVEWANKFGVEDAVEHWMNNKIKAVGVTSCENYME
ncbi:MAG: hypothetical protein ACRC3J_05800 [Culicoidibacterales bacterium]